METKDQPPKPYASKIHTVSKKLANKLLTKANYSFEGSFVNSKGKLKVIVLEDNTKKNQSFRTVKSLLALCKQVAQSDTVVELQAFKDAERFLAREEAR